MPSRFAFCAVATTSALAYFAVGASAAILGSAAADVGVRGGGAKRGMSKTYPRGLCLKWRTPLLYSATMWPFPRSLYL
jgi:hypothetical protein